MTLQGPETNALGKRGARPSPLALQTAIARSAIEAFISPSTSLYLPDKVLEFSMRMNFGIGFPASKRASAKQTGAQSSFARGSSRPPPLPPGAKG